MAPLPNFRVVDGEQRLEAFDRCGIDAAGPYFVKIGRGQAQHKRWLLLFTRLQYHCVHLEMLSSMDTDSFLMAFERFIARRIKPSLCVSDNGLNFRGGEKELRMIWEKFDQDKIRDKHSSIEWKFNPPSSPHTGGSWEAMIKCAKRAINAILPQGTLSDEELCTAFTMISMILNPLHQDTFYMDPLFVH